MASSSSLLISAIFFLLVFGGGIGRCRGAHVDVSRYLPGKEDPSAGWSLAKMFGSEGKGAEPTMTAVACGQGSTISLQCPRGKVIHVKDSYYGRTSKDVCRARYWPENWKDTSCRDERCQPNVRASCQGKQFCSLTSTHTAINFGVDPCYGTAKYLEVTYTCVDRNPDIKFKVTCEHRHFSISCPKDKAIKIFTANYGRTDKEMCQTMYGKKEWDSISCYGKNSEEKVKTMCDGKASCSTRVTNTWFGSGPCDGIYKYLEVSYACVERKVTCELGVFSVSCPAGKTIQIHTANYGRTDKTECNVVAPKYLKSTSCYGKNSEKKLRETCDGRKSCSLIASNSWHGHDPCVGTYKYLDVSYVCQ